MDQATFSDLVSNSVHVSEIHGIVDLQIPSLKLDFA